MADNKRPGLIPGIGIVVMGLLLEITTKTRSDTPAGITMWFGTQTISPFQGYLVGFLIILMGIGFICTSKRK